jgi:hypothetical protein
MTLHFAGYFPKKMTPLPADYDLPGVVEISSISDCIAKGPADWIKSWKFNELGFFDEIGVAESVVPAAEWSQFDLYGYAFLGECFIDGLAEQWAPPVLACSGPNSDFEPLGFDVVNKSVADFFECSPLSCNGAAKTFKANAHCLFETLTEAAAAARTFSEGGWEPGPYYVAQVWRRRRAPT